MELSIANGNKHFDHALYLMPNTIVSLLALKLFNDNVADISVLGCMRGWVAPRLRGLRTQQSRATTRRRDP